MLLADFLPRLATKYFSVTIEIYFYTIPKMKVMLGFTGLINVGIQTISQNPSSKPFLFKCKTKKMGLSVATLPIVSSQDIS
ncbi:hypothetical protein [uncultured Microscilla sp.]|uniref:hypothetical protein n=1 Tax=uncultured Microscilla sp. TaxID=432653 RepID=UPI0026102ABF|nr:hypothetical protein [uncultured Microscilla sp.]